MSETPGFIREEDVWRNLARWRAERRRFVLATVTGSRGFTPRKPGAHMLIAVGGESVGTVGGGAIEHEVLRVAAELLGRGGTTEVRRHLTQELGMCCGGAMTVFLEVVECSPRLYVFGAGYIAKPLAAIATGCGFEVTVADARAAWATPERFPTSTLCARPPDEAVHDLALDAADYAVVMTHDHAVDQRVVEALLARPLTFVGMIGSLAKQRKFALRLKARGFSPAAIARLHTPLGAAIGAQTPEEIAVSVMALLIETRRKGERPAEAPASTAMDAATELATVRALPEPVSGQAPAEPGPVQAPAEPAPVHAPAEPEVVYAPAEPGPETVPKSVKASK